MDEITKKTKPEVEQSEVDIYEVGYHLLPTISEDELSKEVAKIQTLLSENQANIISEEFPILLGLAYNISKKIETKYTNYQKAYFGWIKFEVSKSAIGDIDLKIKNNPSVLRHLIIKTVRENTMSPVVKVQNASPMKKDNIDVPEVVKAEISEAEIDKSIDELVIS